MKHIIIILLTFVNLNLAAQALDFEYSMDLGMGIPLTKGVHQDGDFRFPLLYSNLKANSLGAMLLFKINPKCSAGIGLGTEYYHSWRADNSDLYSGTRVNTITFSPLVKYNFYRKNRFMLSMVGGISYNKMRLDFSKSGSFFNHQNIDYLEYYENQSQTVYSPLLKLQSTYSFRKINFISSLSYRFMRLESPVYFDKGVNNLFFSAGFGYNFSITRLFINKHYYLGE